MGRPASSVGIATELRAGRSGIESLWGRDFPSVLTGPGAHPASCTIYTGSFPGVEAAGAWGWNPHPHLVPKVLKKIRAITLLTLRACVAYKKGENLPTWWWTCVTQLVSWAPSRGWLLVRWRRFINCIVCVESLHSALQSSVGLLYLLKGSSTKKDFELTRKKLQRILAVVFPGTFYCSTWYLITQFHCLPNSYTNQRKGLYATFVYISDVWLTVHLNSVWIRRTNYVWLEFGSLTT